jgi:hypothetical protein
MKYICGIDARRHHSWSKSARNASPQRIKISTSGRHILTRLDCAPWPVCKRNSSRKKSNIYWSSYIVSYAKRNKQKTVICAASQYVNHGGDFIFQLCTLEYWMSRVDWTTARAAAATTAVIGKRQRWSRADEASSRKQSHANKASSRG